MRAVAVIGNLTRDVIGGAPPRVGGAPFHAARALRLLGGRARLVARCAPADRRLLLPPLVSLGLPVHWIPAEATMTFEFAYQGEERRMSIGAVAEPWNVGDVTQIGRAGWVQLGALTQADFPTAVVAALARDRRVALDGQGLVRRAAAGAPVELNSDYDPALLRHVTVLKLAEVEADALGGEDAVAALGVPETLITLGSRGAILRSGGRREVVPARRLGALDPTGAGDAFLAAYVWARAAGHRPLSAARLASATAARVLELGAAA